MKRIILLIIALSFIAGPITLRADGQTNDLQSEINQYMTAVANRQHFMGSILVARGDHVILAKGYGKANLKKDLPNTPNTKFHIGSVTKQFTTMAILMLQNEGKLNVQDHICKYVPKCPGDWQPITIYELLTHTSGIPDYLNSVSPNKAMKRMKGSYTPTQIVGFFKNDSLDFKSGKKFSYSNSGYVVLGYIIEQVSGKSYGQFLQQHIFGPLGMKDSGYGNIDSTAKNRANGYIYISQDKYKSAPSVNFASYIGDGGIYSTVRDLYTWDRALAADKLIPASLQKKMFTKQVQVKGKMAKVFGGGGAAYYGFGWFIIKEFGHKKYGHSGDVPGFTSVNSWFPKQHVYVIVLGNTGSPQEIKIAKDLAAIVFGKKYNVFKKISLPPKALKKFVGTYQMIPEMYLYVTRKGDQLKAQFTGYPNLPVYPESDSSFFLKAIPAQIYFKSNDQGKVTGVVWHRYGSKMGTGKRIDPAKAPKLTSEMTSISLPPKALKKFTGTYQLTPGATITITLKGDQLKAQVTGQSAVPIYPKTKTEFFYKVVDAQISFKISDKGKVTKLILHQAGRNIPAKKIK